MIGNSRSAKKPSRQSSRKKTSSVKASSVPSFQADQKWASEPKPKQQAQNTQSEGISASEAIGASADSGIFDLCVIV